MMLSLKKIKINSGYSSNRNVLSKNPFENRFSKRVPLFWENFKIPSSQLWCEQKDCLVGFLTFKPREQFLGLMANNRLSRGIWIKKYHFDREMKSIKILLDGKQ